MRVFVVAEKIVTFGGEVGIFLVVAAFENGGAYAFEDFREWDFDEAFVLHIDGSEGTRGRLAHDTGKRHFD